MKYIELGKLLEYEQPTKYIVKSTKYNNNFKTPVLTAGQSFILGYTDEKENIFPEEKLPVIIFDDFTTATKFVDFKFKVKSSAMKILNPIKGVNPKYVFYAMQMIKFDCDLHKRYWISEYSNIKIPVPTLEEQNIIAERLDNVFNIIELKENQIKNLEQVIKSQFVEMFLKNEFPKEKLENNVEEMFIGPFGSALKNKCFVEENNGYCVVYEQKHAIYKNIEDFRWIDKDKYESLKRFNVQPKDIIVSCRGTIGKTFVIPENAPLGIMHPSIMKIRLKKEKYIPEFFEMLLQHYFHEKENQTNGATIKMGIKASTLEKEDFIIPDMELQIKYLTFVKQIDKQKFVIVEIIMFYDIILRSILNNMMG